MSGLYGLGRAFNLKYRPNGPLKTFIYDRRMPVIGFGGRPHVSHGTFMQENIVIDYGKRGFWGNLADIITGLAGGLAIVGNLFGGSKSDVVQGPEEKQVKPQGAKSTDDTDAENLKRLEVFAKPKGIQVVSEGNGKFTLLAKDGKNIKDAEYKDAQDWIMNYNATTAPERTNVEKTNTDPVQETTVEPDGDSSRVTQDGSERTQRSRRSSGKGNVDDVEPPAQNDPKVDNKKIDKTKAYTKVITIKIIDKKVNASVTMPDGKTYSVTAEKSLSRHEELNEVLHRLGTTLKTNGWTNVTLKLPANNKNTVGIDKNAVATENEEKSDKSVQNKDKANAAQTEWTAQKKAAWNKPLTMYDVRIDEGTMYSAGGNAKVKTPDGKVYYATTGKSIGSRRAREAIMEQLQQLVRADGWTKATVTYNG